MSGNVELQIANCKLQIANLRFQVSNCQYLTLSFKFQISDLKSQISNFRSQIVNCIFFVLAVIAGSTACAATPPSSTDDQLRDSLNSKAGDDYDRELLGDPAKPADGSRVDDQMQKRLQKELGPAAQREDARKSPLLLQVAETMRGVQPRLGQRDSGELTQSLQRQIVDDLEKLIRQAKQSGNGGKSSSDRQPAANGQTNPSQPAGDASARAKTSDPKPHRTPDEVRAEGAKEKAIERMKSMYAELPKHEREHVLEPPSEHFLPEYELEIEDYFRRLSEDQPDIVKP